MMHGRPIIKIFEHYSNTKFHENPSKGSQAVLCERTDRHNGAKSPFAVSRMRLKKEPSKLFRHRERESNTKLQNGDLQNLCFSLILLGDQIRLLAECLRSWGHDGDTQGKRPRRKERHMWKNNILKILIRMDDWEWIQQAQTVGSGEHWCAMQERDPVTNSFSKMTPRNAVHHVYVVVFSTLVPRAKLQSGVSLAVLWRAVSGLSFVSDTEHGLTGANLWLPSWDFSKEFVKGRNENTRRSSNRNWIRWQDIFVPIYHIRETCVWGTAKHKQRGKHALWDT